MKTKSQIILIIFSIVISFSEQKITFWKPATLSAYFEEHPLTYSISSFGKVPYGHSIIGRVILANPVNLCADTVINTTETEVTGSTIILTKRGDCPFAKKAFNAQNSGANLVIFIDSSVEDVGKILPFKDPSFTDSITIPSIQIDKDSGEKIFDTLITNEAMHNTKENPVIVVDFELGYNARSDVAWLMSVNNYDSFVTLRDINWKYNELKEYVRVMPVYYAYRKLSKSVDNHEDSAFHKPDDYETGDGFTIDPSEECLFKQRDFCVKRADGKAIKTTYSSPQLETIKQLCVYDIDKEEWFEYISKFAQSCFVYDPYFKKMVLVEDLENCSHNIDTKSHNEIVQCANEIFSDVAPLNVKIILNNIGKLEIFHTDIIPSINVNGNILRGELTEQTILEDFCESMTSTPEVCRNIEHTKSYAAANTIGGPRINIRFIQKFSFFVFSICFFMQITFYCVYKCQLRKDMEEQVGDKMNDALSKYYVTENTNGYAGASFNNKKDVKVTLNDAIEM